MFRRVFSKIAKHWYLYLIWVIVAVMTWDIIFAFLTKVPKEEKVEIFVGEYDSDWETLDKLCKDNMPQYLKTVNVRRYKVNQTYFSEMAQIQGSVADVFILPESKAEEVKVYYLPLDIENVQAVFGDVDFYEIDGTSYGIKINSHGNAENYYLFFGSASVHLGDWNDSKLNGAIRLAEVILNYEDE